MKRLCMVLLLVMALGLSGQVLGAEKQPVNPPAKEAVAQPTQAQLLATQQAVLTERLQKLEAQYALTQQQLSQVLTQQKALAEEEAKKKAKDDKGK